MSIAEQLISNPPSVDEKFIYVVDDEPMIGDVVQIILRLDGYKPRFFSDPEDAWRTMLDEKAKPILLLTDFVMSPINGIELIQRCKQHCPHLKTILYSGNASEDILVQAAIKPDAFLRKPFLPRTLLNLIRSTLP